MRIYVKLITAFLAFIIIPMMFASYIFFYNCKSVVEKQVLDQLNTNTDLAVSLAELFFSKEKLDHDVLKYSQAFKATFSVLDELINDRKNPLFLEAVKKNDEQVAALQVLHKYIDIMIVNKQGLVIYTSNHIHRFYELGEYLYGSATNISLIGRKEGSFASIYRIKDIGHPYVAPATYSLFDTSGELVGLLVLEFDVGPMFEALQKSIGLENSQEILVVTKSDDNKVRFLSTLKFREGDSLSETIDIGSSVGLPAQKAALGESGSGVSIDYRGKKVLSAWRPIPLLGWGVVAKVDLSKAFEPMGRLRKLLVIIFVTVILSTLMAAIALARSISVPIQELRKGVGIVSSGNLDYQMDANSKDEIGDLSQGFNTMVQTLKKSLISIDRLNDEVAQRKALEDNLRASEKKFRSFIEASLEGFGAIDANLHLTQVNKRLAQMFGYDTPEQMVGLHVLDDLTPRDVRSRMLKQMRSRLEGDPSMYETEFVRKDQSRFWAIVSGTPVFDAQGKFEGSFAMVTDITKLKKAEERLTQALIEASKARDILSSLLDDNNQVRENLEKNIVELQNTNAKLKEVQAQVVQAAKLASVGQLAGAVAHEINNPLTGVINNVQLVKMQAVDGGNFNLEEFAQILDAVEESAMRCKRITQALLAFSHASTGVSKPLSLNEVVEKVEVLVAHELKLQNIIIEKNLFAGLPLIFGDSQLLQQVIFNFISNAKWAIEKKNAKEGGVIKIETRYDADKKEAHVSVSDSGVGISPENIKKIFDPYFSTKEVGEGTGIGLSLVADIISSHRGRIEVQSQEGQGATFKVIIPVIIP